ncbi:MAG TPA: aminoacyl-tRNA hydrolase [Blastocatellia bacterium]|nr:aminoacyl-tRNA hydrolase [Blastocatellia bacterium]
MKVIAGLGNPGRDYDDTRHNLGFMLIDRLFARSGGRGFRAEANALVAEAGLAGERVILVKPQTFMNLSGDSVRPLLARYGEADAKNLIVTCDDVALPFGMVRVRPGGSAGGQKGLKSIIDRLGTNDFPRVRIGIRPDHPVSDLSRFVLARIPRGDRELLDATLDRAADAVEMILSEGVARAMSAFNERVKPEAAQ